jgi:hypothetical protein
MYLEIDLLRAPRGAVERYRIDMVNRGDVKMPTRVRFAQNLLDEFGVLA